MGGQQIIIAQINRALANAVAWAIQMKAAMVVGDEAAMQHAAAGIHTNSQTAQVLAHSVERQLSKQRRGRPHE